MIDNSSSSKMDSVSNGISSSMSSTADTAKSSAQDFAANAVSKAKDIGGRIGGQVMDRLGTIPDVSRQYAGRIDASARANPWLHIGLIGVGSLALGYFLGRRLSAAPTDSDVKGLGEIYNH
jgi:ElaB/YqjD/DUF883 family membrane-anchored ribosome-binding protein